MVTWPGMVLFEYLAPIVEFSGWIIVPTVLFMGAINIPMMFALLGVAFGAGVANSLLAILLDESFGFYNSPKDIARLVVMALIENLGFRQRTVVWRVRAFFGGKATKIWGNMERRGVANLGTTPSKAA
jgi:hypothetical protein